ncbi:ABC transporter permease [Bacillota bacterium Meth-B3]
MIRWGMIRESVSMSIGNIFANRMRSFLTVLGIVIGVTAIIALITIVEGVTYEVNAQFESLGAGKLNVTVTGTALKRGLNEGDMEAIRALDDVSGVSPSVSLTKTVLANGRWEEDIPIDGQDELYFRKSPKLVGRGRELNRLDIESASQVCLIDEVLMKKLFFGVDPLGRQVCVGGRWFTVVGMLSSDDADVMAQMSMGEDGRLIVPYTAAMQLDGLRGITSLAVYMGDTAKSERIIAHLKQALTSAFNGKDDTYRVINMQSLLDTMSTMTGMMTGLLAGIASIALLVGGIGIMNMMLVSVTERTAEIGLRKALGAQPGQIQLQFLIESFLLSTMGGLIGMGLGLAISFLFSLAIDTPFRLSPFAVLLGVGFSATVGVVFGWTPARKASNLNPIDALRSV